jgi:hypothetical protein
MNCSLGILLAQPLGLKTIRSQLVSPAGQPLLRCDVVKLRSETRGINVVQNMILNGITTKKIGRNSRKRWPIINGQWLTSTGRGALNKKV